MFKENKILYVIIAALALWILFQKNCSGKKDEPETIEIVVPEKKGVFKPVKPIYMKPDSSYLYSWPTEKEYIEIETENPVNEKLLEQYKQAKDSLERFKLYLNSIEEKNFSQTFEDSLTKIDIFGNVRGDINSIEASYIIKEQKVKTELPKTLMRFLIGGEIENNTQFTDFRMRATLGLQNKKGDIFRVGYSKIRGLDYVMLGYEKSIFTIKGKQ